MWCGLHSGQNFLNTNSWVHKWDCPILSTISCNVTKLCKLQAITMQWRIIIYPLRPYLQIFPHHLREVKWSLIEEKTWISLEQNMFGFKWKWREKSVWKTPHYIAFVRILNYMDESYILRSLQPKHTSLWLIFLPSSSIHIEQNPKTTILSMDWSIVCIHVAHLKP
jgi:hypothetical protein